MQVLTIVPIACTFLEKATRIVLCAEKLRSFQLASSVANPCTELHISCGLNVASHRQNASSRRFRGTQVDEASYNLYA